MKRHLHLIMEPDPELAYLVDMRGEVPFRCKLLWMPGAPVEVATFNLS